MDSLISEDEIARLLPFSDHRLQLSENLWTTPNGVDPRDDIRTKILQEQSCFSLAGKRIIDVGCLEGGYAATFAQLGAREVLGVEARSLSIERCLLVQRALGLDNCSFFRADARTVTRDAFGAFDIAFVVGLLYHLDDPFTFLLNISQMTTEFLFLDTHVAHPEFWNHGCEPFLIARTWDGKSYVGRTVLEYSPGASQEEIEGYLWASYGNSTSFWPTEDSLVDMLHAVGFAYVTKIHMPAGYRCDRNCPRACRVVLIAKHTFPEV